MIAGDVDGEVKSITFAKGDAAVTGYGILPQKPAQKLLNKTYYDGKVMVKAEYTAEAMIPDNAILVAKEVSQDDELYQKHLETVQQMVGEEVEGPSAKEEENEEGISTVSEEGELESEPETEEEKLYMRVYNIGFYLDEQEIEPQAEVKISIEFLDDPGFAAGANKVIHMAKGGEPEALEMTNTEGEEDGKVMNKIEFSTKLF